VEIDDDLIEALGGGDIGRELFAKLQRAAKGGAFASRCSTCRRWYVHYGFAHWPITLRLRDVLIGDRATSRCRECSPSGSSRPPTSPPQ